MKMRSVLIMAGLLVITLPTWADCGVCGPSKKSGPGPRSHTHAEIGKPAPDFTLEDLKGTEHRLSDLKGKVVVLEWINHECPFVNRCHRPNSVMTGTPAKFRDKPVAWLAIDSSYFSEKKVDKIRKWVKKRKIEYPVLLDASGRVGHAYEAKTTPHMFVIDRNGVLAYSGAIDDDPYGRKDRKRNYVEEAVTALLNDSTVATTATKSYGCGVKYKS